MAACPMLSIVATSCWEDNTISVFSLPNLHFLYAMGGPGQLLACVFQFKGTGINYRMGNGGQLAFTTTGPPHLLVSKAKSLEVSIVHLRTKTVVGTLAARPDGDKCTMVMGIACRGSHVALSVLGYSYVDRDVCGVQLFMGGPATWEFVRFLHYGPVCSFIPIYEPHGLRLTADGASVIVAETTGCTATWFSAHTGEYQNYCKVEVPIDVEEIPGGWLVSTECEVTGMAFIARQSMWRTVSGMQLCRTYGCASTLAWVQGVGLITRCRCAEKMLRVRVLPDAVLVLNMSSIRISWMIAVTRGIFYVAKAADATNAEDAY